MDIESLSEKTLEVLYEHLSVREPQDLYQLTADRLVGLPGFQRKKAEKVVEALNISRDCQLDAFLLAIGIPNIGRATARDLALHFGSLQALREAAAEQLQEVPEVGGVVAAGIVEFFADPLNAHMVDALLQAGVRPRDMAPQQQGGVFQGKTFVLTGTLPTLTRQQAEELIVRHGGTVSSSVSRKTSYLLLGENPGSKAQKAKELGIEAMDEARLLSSVNNQ